MPLILGPSATGILPVGDGSLADLEELIPKPDKLQDAGSTGHHLDEMSPAAAVQLRIEINKYLATNGENPDNAIVSDSQTLAVAVTGSYTDSVTFTVVDGEITAIALS